MVFNATFNNILAISWWSVLLVEEEILVKLTNSFNKVKQREIKNVNPCTSIN